MSVEEPRKTALIGGFQLSTYDRFSRTTDGELILSDVALVQSTTADTDKIETNPHPPSTQRFSMDCMLATTGEKTERISKVSAGQKDNIFLGTTEVRVVPKQR